MSASRAGPFEIWQGGTESACQLSACYWAGPEVIGGVSPFRLGLGQILVPGRGSEKPGGLGFDKGA